MFAYGKKSQINFKADIKKFNFPCQFCIGSISEEFNSSESKEVSFKGNEYDFSVYFRIINKYDICNIQEYLIIKNNMEQCLVLLRKFSYVIVF